MVHAAESTQTQQEHHSGDQSLAGNRLHVSSLNIGDKKYVYMVPPPTANNTARHSPMRPLTPNPDAKDQQKAKLGKYCVRTSFNLST
jgi:hypothetical protein